MAYLGISVVDYLKSIGQASDFASRTALATSKGIQNYSGTADQNTQLLNILRGSTPTTQPSVQQPVNQTPVNQTPVVPSQTTPVQNQTPYIPPTQVQNQTPYVPPVVQNQTPVSQAQNNQSYTVQSGDTISSIASRLGVPASSISGYRSGNPNLIYPGESLTIGQSGISTTPTQSPSQVPTSQTPYTPEEATQKISELSEQLKPLQEKLQAIQQAGEKGMEITPDTSYEEAVNFLSDYGVNVDEGKTMTNPTGSWQDTYQQLFSQLGLDKVKTNIDDTIAKIDALNSEKAGKAADINDNPWISEAERSRQIAKLEDEYGAKEASLTNTLTLYQNTYNQGREEAQFLVTTALSQYNAEREFDLAEQKMLADQAEAQAKAIADLMKVNPAIYKEVQGGLYNIETGEWVVPPKETGEGGLTTAQINSTVNQIAGAFDNEPIVKAYNEATSGYQTLLDIGTESGSPADDIAFIYAFAKIMDPNSVVREGEYATIQRYAQSWADDFGFKAQRIFSNTNFLSKDAKEKMLATLGTKYKAIQGQYENLRNSYQSDINSVKTGQFRGLPEYSGAASIPGVSEDQVIELNNLGIDTDLAREIYNDISSGRPLDEMREAIRQYGLDPAILDQFDQVVGIENIR
jgi:LysM repeat protein